MIILFYCESSVVKDDSAVARICKSRSLPFRWGRICAYTLAKFLVSLSRWPVPGLLMLVFAWHISQVFSCARPCSLSLRQPRHTGNLVLCCLSYFSENNISPFESQVHWFTVKELCRYLYIGPGHIYLAQKSSQQRWVSYHLQEGISVSSYQVEAYLCCTSFNSHIHITVL